MERLWAPWRRTYVEKAGRSEEGCFLCRKAGEDRDEENLILCRGRLCFAILNLYPYNTGHTMVAPYRHTGDITSLDPDTVAEMWDMATRVVRALEREYRPDGFNLGLNLGRSAGAGLEDHLHLHIVPRWSGDTNFMPVLAETKVIPEALESTYRRLRPLLAGG